MSSRAYRIAPRRKPPARSASRIDWERAGRIALVVVLFVILILYINPAVNFFDAWQDRKTGSAELEELKQENTRLRERAAILAQPDAAERGARRLGMVAEGERSVVICEGDAEDCASSG